MKFTEKSVGTRAEFLASEDFDAIPHTFSANTEAGAAVSVTDGLGTTYKGLCLYDVNVDENPNGAVVVRGTVTTSKLPAVPTGTMFPTLIFLPW